MRFLEWVSQNPCLVLVVLILLLGGVTDIVRAARGRRR